MKDQSLIIEQIKKGKTPAFTECIFTQKQYDELIPHIKDSNYLRFYTPE